jgi:hypothetical protein
VVGGINTLGGVQRCPVRDAGAGDVPTMDFTVVTEHSYDF